MFSKRIKLITASICLISTSLFSQTIDKEKEAFYFAKQQLENMLLGRDSLDYEKAVFITENAYYNNQLNAEKFYDRLSVYSNLIDEVAKNKLTKTENDFKSDLIETKYVKFKRYESKVKNWAIFKFLTDTTFIKSGSDMFYHKPYAYSCLDPSATKNWENSQVVNLVASSEQTGNCYALTSLFKLLSNRIKSNANIATAPNHIFIVHKDERDITYNVEIGSKAFPGNGSIEAMTYTTNKAIKSHIVMRTLNDKQSIVLNLIYLAKSYQFKFKTNTDNFILECANTALKHDPLSLNAMLLKSEISENILFEKLETNQINSVFQLNKFSELKKEFENYEKQIIRLYELGYLEMPVEMKNIIISAYLKDNYLLVLVNHTPTSMQSSGIKHDKDYVTLSGGLFEESPTAKDKEKYSRVILDTKTKKIVGFTQRKDTTYNNYNFDPVLFALSVDPMAKKFASYSPYTFADDNPIWKIDQDGDSTRYYSERGALLHSSNDGLSNAIVIVNSANMSKFMIWKKEGDKQKVGSNSGYNEYLRKMGLTYNINSIKKFHDKYKNIKYKNESTGKETSYNTEHGALLFNNSGSVTIGDKVLGQKDGNDPTTTKWANLPSTEFNGNVGNIHTHTNEGKPYYDDPMGTGEYGPSLDDKKIAGKSTFSGKINVAVSEYNIYFYGSEMDRTININPKKFGESEKPVEKTYTPK